MGWGGLSQPPAFTRKAWRVQTEPPCFTVGRAVLEQGAGPRFPEGGGQRRAGGVPRTLAPLPRPRLRSPPSRAAARMRLSHMWVPSSQHEAWVTTEVGSWEGG